MTAYELLYIKEGYHSSDVSFNFLEEKESLSGFEFSFLGSLLKRNRLATLIKQFENHILICKLVLVLAVRYNVIKEETLMSFLCYFSDSRTLIGN